MAVVLVLLFSESKVQLVKRSFLVDFGFYSSQIWIALLMIWQLFSHLRFHFKNLMDGMFLFYLIYKWSLIVFESDFQVFETLIGSSLLIFLDGVLRPLYWLTFWLGFPSIGIGCHLRYFDRWIGDSFWYYNPRFPSPYYFSSSLCSFQVLDLHA